MDAIEKIINLINDLGPNTLQLKNKDQTRCKNKVSIDKIKKIK
jgi:hypothetical protein